MEDLEWVNRTSLSGLRLFREKMLWLIGQITDWQYPTDPERLATYRCQVAACEKRIAELEAASPQGSDAKSE